MSNEASKLRAACASMRTKSMPLSDLIPLMQQAADELDMVRIAHPVAPIGRDGCDYVTAEGRFCRKCRNIHLARAASPADSMTLVSYQFRWLNPSNDLNVSTNMLEWSPVITSHLHTEQQYVDDLLAYRYGGKPVYQVRALYTPAINQAQPVKGLFADMIAAHGTGFAAEMAASTAQPVQPAVILQDQERAAFLDWHDNRRNSIKNAWAAWQARAALAVTLDDPATNKWWFEQGKNVAGQPAKSESS